MDRNLLPAIAAFAEVAREGSFTRAASKLAVSPSALSQTLRVLEERLSVRLLNRSTRSVSVTEEGRKLLADINPGLAMIEHAVALVQDAKDRPAGEIRINSSRLAASHFLEPHLGEFARRYPLVKLEIVVDDGFGDIVREGCDGGVRLRESVVDSMIAVPISPPIRMAVVASPAYLATYPPPETPFDLERHNCLGLRHGNSNIVSAWEFTDPSDGREFTFEPTGSFVTNGDDIMLSAAIQGVGLIMHMDFAVRDHVARGTLVRVLETWCQPFDGFDLYLPTRDQMAAKIRALIDFLVEKRRHTN
ncbi:DNA-binding transcriptional LysR family regulator [Rhizobium sp. BK275]|uniref:LysR family transcriptional regulator n=1 Tax=Rhizobium sp. BK275 TaxID=2587077 RepID=UPI0016180AF5|nr:LysR family transcriptional regulator [Rhizobium sp. BK275]MBB3389722.1 DNA-binding transcriptional LysR family regulator [Rhizobium sp. BK275]